MKKKSLIIIISLLSVSALQAQFLKKLKEKVNNAVNSSIDNATNKAVDKNVKKPLDSTFDKTLNGPSNTKTTDNKPTNDVNKVAGTKTAGESAPLTVYSKFDFVPGTSILYYDNFEKDNIGEAPLGWITSSSAEVVTIDGLEGKWLKMGGDSRKQIIRNKKQSWGNNFTIEFDLLIVKNTYDPRIDFLLYNSGGNLVSDESILQNENPAIQFGTILANGGKSSRATLKGFEGKKLSENMSENLPYSNSTPVHISICVQDKRFRLWWNEHKEYDLSAINDKFLPNQFGFNCNMSGSDFYVSNIRVAKDIPDTRAAFNTGKIISNLLFYSGTATLRPESMGALLDVSKIIKDAPDPVKIVGHTDSDGDDASNLKLSQQRAEAVKTILVKEYGIDESKLTTEGRGETQPIADNKTAEGKAQNRRVEFIFKADADKYEAPKNISSSSTINHQSSTNTIKSNTSVNSNNVSGGITLKSKTINTNLPYAYFLKSDDGGYTLIASKEEGNAKENYLKLNLQTVGDKLSPETFCFDEYNKKTKLLYGTKKYPTISGSEAKLFYGNAPNSYISSFSPYIADGHMSKFYDALLSSHFPPASEKCKLVIEKIVDGKASGYFVLGTIVDGLKPIKVGSDTGTETFTTGFSGEIVGKFSNVPIN